MVSPARLYRATVGTAIPADTLAAGGVWPAGWTAVGYTKTPLTVEYSFEALMYDIQESLNPVGARKIKETLRLETTLAEMSLSAVAQSWGGTVSTTAAGAGQPGKEELTGGGSATILRYAYGFEGTYEDSSQVVRPVRFFIWIGQAESGGTLEFGKADYVGIPLKIVAMADMAKPVGQQLYLWQRITAAATS
jgi:hypothetical protein